MVETFLSDAAIQVETFVIGSRVHKTIAPPSNYLKFTLNHLLGCHTYDNKETQNAFFEKETDIHSL